MAFVAPGHAIRIAPCMGSRGRNASSRRGGSRGGGTARNRAARLDPILDDGDIDMTDIATFASCGKCCNSIMLSPDQFRNGPLQVRCNVCDLPATVTVEMLENIDGTPFDAHAWRIREATDIAMGRRTGGGLGNLRE